MREVEDALAAAMREAAAFAESRVGRLITVIHQSRDSVAQALTQAYARGALDSDHSAAATVKRHVARLVFAGFEVARNLETLLLGEQPDLFDRADVDAWFDEGSEQQQLLELALPKLLLLLGAYQHGMDREIHEISMCLEAQALDKAQRAHALDRLERIVSYALQADCDAVLALGEMAD